MQTLSQRVFVAQGQKLNIFIISTETDVQDQFNA